jgi:hypothetical protein
MTDKNHPTATGVLQNFHIISNVYLDGSPYRPKSKRVQVALNQWIEIGI